MKTTCFTLLCLGFLFLSTGSTNPDPGSIAQFNWMLGKWQGKSGKGEMHETWRKLDEQTLTGEGYFIIKGDTVLRELLRIQRIGNFWTYIPVVGKQEPVLFTLKEARNGKWLFENKEHNFPQRIVYQQQPDGSLLAYIEGKMLGKTTKEEYRMQKVQ